MAARFGAVSPAQTYATKIRWILGCMVSIIVILGVAIFMLWQNSETPDQAQAVTPTDPASQTVQSSTIDVLAAAARVEEGTRIEAHMFTTVPMDAEKTPMAVVRAKDINSIIGMYAKRQINPNMPLVMDDLSDTRPVNTIRIPPGYRAITININNRSGVEGFAKPNSRVDVLWTYTQDAKQKVATIVRFVKILSLGGVTQANAERAAVAGDTTVTLLVTEKDAKKIELARTMGELSLSLVGDQEQGETSVTEPESITINDLIGRPATDDTAQLDTDGVMYTADPRTGKQIRYVLRNGRWVRDDGFDEQQ